jgi:N6-adenosine-specific RNA methylase IME4
MSKIAIDRGFKSLIPPISEEEYQQLEANILRDGCREPLVVWKWTLLDGHNRLKICEEHGLEYDVEKVKLPDRTAAKVWIIHNQFGRRNLQPYQRAELALKLEPLIRPTDEKHRGGRGKAIPKSERVSTTHEVAKLAGLGHDTIAKAKKIQEKADKETKEKLRRGEVSVNRVYGDIRREEKREEVVEKLENTSTKKAKKLEGVYDVIVIDPPWPMKKIERDVRPNQVETDYPTMTEDEIADLKIPYAKDCHVWLWTTHRFLPMGLRLLEKWKLKYVCTFVWHKPGGFQPVGLPQYNCEFVLYARKGSPQFVDTKAFPTCFKAARGKHSEKPDSFYASIHDRTAGRRLDMFSRRKINGFDSWGNEA